MKNWAQSSRNSPSSRPRRKRSSTTQEVDLSLWKIIGGDSDIVHANEIEPTDTSSSDERGQGDGQQC